jgi:hypothetical protein
MSRTVRHRVIGLALATLIGSGVWTAVPMAQAAPKPASQNQEGKERHPVLQNSIRQIEAIKDRLQNAPTDFGGHKEAAIDALNRAMNELRQAVQYDKH